MPLILRSALTTFLVTLLGLVPVTALLGGDISWLQSALSAAILATLRTLVAYIDPGNTSFGIGATDGTDVPAGDVSP